MKTRTTLLLALLCAPFVSFGEYEYPSASLDSNEVSITGRILDERSQPLPGATILLDDPLTNTLVKGEVSDPDGLFVFENIPPASMPFPFNLSVMPPIRPICRWSVAER
ncbi:MAG: carboxypeptidase regulatory-like domain-containing protein [Saprospirales bacterium]|nr:carboxypeptidase regulatory-like domain-containing protein [Saprospirales bacterium]